MAKGPITTITTTTETESPTTTMCRDSSTTGSKQVSHPSSSRSPYYTDHKNNDRGPWIKLFLAVPIAYCSIFTISRLVVGVWFDDEEEISTTPITGEGAYIFTLCFFIFFTPLLYAFCCGLAGEFLTFEWQRLVLYMGATFFGGALGEIGIGGGGEYMLGRKVWKYQIWPKHDGSTSGVGAVMWPMYGFYLYLLHEALRKRGCRQVENAFFSGLLIGVDAMALETMANTFSLANFNIFYFWYVGSDLKHFTSAEIFIPYVVSGTLGSMLLNALDRPHIPVAAMGVTFYLIGIVMVFGLDALVSSSSWSSSGGVTGSGGEL